eukprot:TCONS_00004723-protein
MMILAWLIIQSQIFLANGTLTPEDKMFNLVSTGKEYEGITAIYESTVPDKRTCISKCFYNTKCLSYDVYKVSDQAIECRMFNVTFDYFLYFGHQLIVRSGVEIQSKFFIKTSCVAWYKSGARTNGVYKVLISGKYVKAVYCDMQEDGGGWMAFQRRFDGSVTFSERLWSEYRDGFGQIAGEHWLGNEVVHQMTLSQPHDLLFIGRNFSTGEFTKKKMKNFLIKSEDEFYFMTYSINYPEYPGLNVFTKNRNFSTIDRDHDKSADKNCADLFGKGGWWFGACSNNQMNGRYILPGSSVDPKHGMYHSKWSPNESLKSSLFLIRPIQ